MYIYIYIYIYLYLKIPGSGQSFLRTNSDNIRTDEDELWTDVIAIEPDTRNWTHKTQDGSRKVTIKRRQFPLLLHKTSTLHGIQGKTAEPGMCAHWSFPKHLSAEALWLAHYVILSRPRSLKDLVSYGLKVVRQRKSLRSLKDSLQKNSRRPS